MQKKDFFAGLDPTAGKTEKNLQVLKAFLDATGGQEAEPAVDESGWPLTRALPSLETLKGGVELGRMPLRVARRMAQDLLRSWSEK